MSDYPLLPDSMVRACPECGRLVRDFCYHDGVDIPSMLMSSKQAHDLRVETYHHLMGEIEDLMEDGDDVEG